MPAYDFYRTVVSGTGYATADSQLVTIWFGSPGAPDEPAPGDPAYQAIIYDTDGDGLIDDDEITAAFGSPPGHNGADGADLLISVGTGGVTAPRIVYSGYPIAAGQFVHDPKTWDHTFEVDPGEYDVPCFAAGTVLRTDSGTVPVEAVHVGDRILTRDNGVQPVRWVGAKTLSADRLSRNPNLRPSRIRAGALGANVPDHDLIVSPQHRVLVRSKIAMRMFGAMEVLVAARHLLAVDGVEIAADLTDVTYYHVLFDRHEVVFSNGAETESLFTGPQALRSVGKAAAAEIFELFPELEGRDPSLPPDGARIFASGREGRNLARRHARGQRPLVI